MENVLRIQRLVFPLGRWNLIVVGGSEFNLSESQLLATLAIWRGRAGCGPVPSSSPCRLQSPYLVRLGFCVGSLGMFLIVNV